MEESLASLLCDHPWQGDSATDCKILFTKDGGGELVCRSELDVWIAAEIEWKLLSPEPLSTMITLDGTTKLTTKSPFTPVRRPSFSSRPQPTSTHLTDVDIQITLTKRPITSISSTHSINDALLTDAAFQPKTYTLRLEKGTFHPYELEKLKIAEWYPTFALRLTFDRAPFPGRDEWRRPEGAPDVFEFWEWNIFLGRNAPRRMSEVVL